MGKCKFKETWLEEKDATGRQMKLRSRAVLADLFSFYCSISNTSPVCHKGSYTSLQRARTAEYKKNFTIKLTPNQLCLLAASSMESSKTAHVPRCLYSARGNNSNRNYVGYEDD